MTRRYAADRARRALAPGGGSKCGVEVEPDCFAFQAPPENARTLRRAGVDLVNTANNHAFDFGPLGWRGTRDALAAAKVGAVGAPGEIAVLERNGTRIAFLGFSTYPWSSPMSDDDVVRALVQAADAKAEIVVCFVHAGAEGARRDARPARRERQFGEDRGDIRRFARVAIDAGADLVSARARTSSAEVRARRDRRGADLVLGSGPHVLRGMEVYKDRLAAYSLGNLAGWDNFGTGGTLSAQRAAAGPARSRRPARPRPRHVAAPRRPRRPAPRSRRDRGERLMRRRSAQDFGAASPWRRREMGSDTS